MPYCTSVSISFWTDTPEDAQTYVSQLEGALPDQNATPFIASNIAYEDAFPEPLPDPPPPIEAV